MESDVIFTAWQGWDLSRIQLTSSKALQMRIPAGYPINLYYVPKCICLVLSCEIFILSVVVGRGFLLIVPKTKRWVYLLINLTGVKFLARELVFVQHRVDLDELVKGLNLQRRTKERYSQPWMVQSPMWNLNFWNLKGGWKSDVYLWCKQLSKRVG